MCKCYPLPVTGEMATEAEPDNGSTVSSATHSTLSEQIDGLDFILNEVFKPVTDSETSTPVKLQYTLHL